MILDTKWNIFGGFTPLKWESRVWNWKHGNDNNDLKADYNLKSFLFTLKNPHNISARRFALKSDMKQQEILCSSKRGQSFGYFLEDVCVFDDCSSTLKLHFPWPQLHQ
jgi:hypothetical protein